MQLPKRLYPTANESEGRMRLHCSFCGRSIGVLWPQCPVCRTRQFAWYVIALGLALVVAGLLYFFLFRAPAPPISH